MFSLVIYTPAREVIAEELKNPKAAKNWLRNRWQHYHKAKKLCLVCPDGTEVPIEL